MSKNESFESRAPTKVPDAPKAAKSSGALPVSKLRNLKFPKTTLKHSEQNHADAWMHESAAALHCWAEHAYHSGEEMALSQSDYDAALEAVCKADKRGNYKPHPAAKSKFAGAGIKNERPKV